MESTIDRSKDYINLSHLEYSSDPMDPFYENFFIGIVSRMRLKKSVKKLSGLKDKIILDAGCEAGYQSLKLAEAGLNVIPLDVCGFAISDFKKKLEDSPNEKITTPMVADLYDIPLTDSSVNAVICSEVIQFIPSLKDMFKEFERVLKKDGILLISFGNQRNRRLFFPLLKIIGVDPKIIEKTFPHKHSIQDIIGYAGGNFLVEDVNLLPTRYFTLSTIVTLRKKK